MRTHLLLTVALLLLLPACMEDGPEGIARAQKADTTVKMDFFHRPLRDVRLPMTSPPGTTPTRPRGVV